MDKMMVPLIALVLLSFAIGFFLYPSMPETMAGHWNAQGQVDGYMSKFWGLFLMPVISAGLLLVFAVIPYVDPLRDNISKFKDYYYGFVLTMFIFLLYLYLLTIFWNLGARFNIIYFLVPAFAALFYYVGILVENAKRNWFIGVRTPWTLSDERVWDRTHRLGGRLFKAAGVIGLLGLLVPEYAFFIIIVPVLFVVIYVFVYSYLEFKKLPGKKRRR